MAKKKQVVESNGVNAAGVVPVAMLEKYAKTFTPDVQVLKFEVGNECIECKVKHRLTFEECVVFVNDVVSACVSEENGMVLDYSKQFMIDKNILMYYSNFRIPNNIENAYNCVLAAGNIVDSIKEIIDKRQYSSICKGIEEGIRFKKECVLNEQSKKLSDIIAQLNDMTEKFQRTFGGIDQDKIPEFISTVASMKEIDNKTLAEVFAQKMSGVREDQ